MQIDFSIKLNINVRNWKGAIQLQYQKQTLKNAMQLRYQYRYERSMSGSRSGPGLEPGPGPGLLLEKPIRSSKHSKDVSCRQHIAETHSVL